MIIFLPISFFFFLLSLVFSGQLEYYPWEQVQYIYNNYFFRNIFDAVSEQYPHFPRYLLVYPSYILSFITKIDLTRIYSIQILLNLFITSLIWNKIMIFRRIDFFENSLKTLFPLLLAFFINGRFSFAILGISLLLYNLVKRDLLLKTNYLIDLIGVIFVNATSGTALAGFLLFLFGNYRFLLKDINYSISRSLFGSLIKKKFFDFLLILLISFVVFFYLILYIHRNIVFYGGYNFSSMSGLLGHGLGIIVSNDKLVQDCNLKFSDSIRCEFTRLIDSNLIVISLLIILFVFSSILYVSIIKSSILKLYSKKVIFISTLSGLFGITSFLTIIAVLPTISNKELLSFFDDCFNKNFLIKKLKENILKF